MGTEGVGADNWKLMIMGTRRVWWVKGQSVGWVVRGGVGWVGTVWDGKEIQSPLTTLLCSPGGAGHLSGSHFTHYQQPTTDRLKLLQGETGERESAVCGVECA